MMPRQRNALNYLSLILYLLLKWVFIPPFLRLKVCFIVPFFGLPWVLHLTSGCQYFYGVIINYLAIDEFLQNNSVSSNIQLAVEVEKDRLLPFLDVQFICNLIRFELTYIKNSHTLSTLFIKFIFS